MKHTYKHRYHACSEVKTHQSLTSYNPQGTVIDAADTKVQGSCLVCRMEEQ